MNSPNELGYTAVQSQAALGVVRQTCLALPETNERLSHGSPTFSIRDKKSFVMFLDDHHGDGRLALWLTAPAGVQAAMIESEPDRFFYPPYVGGRGWLGVHLTGDVDWDELAAIVTEAYRCVAPAKLVVQLSPGP